MLAAVVLILWRSRVPWPVALLAGLLAGCAVDVRSEGLPVLLMFPVVLLVRGLRQDGAWRWRNWRAWLAAAAMAVGCAAPVAAYAAWFGSWWGSYTLSRAEGFYLWGRVSSFAECSAIKPPASEMAICPSGTPSSRTPPGDYIWHAPHVHHLAGGGPVTAANDALLRDFAIRAVKAQPFGYLHAVLGGLALSVEWPRHPYPDPGTVYNGASHPADAGRACGAPLTPETSASPAGLSAGARPQAWPDERAANLRQAARRQNRGALQ